MTPLPTQRVRARVFFWRVNHRQTYRSNSFSADEGVRHVSATPLYPASALVRPRPARATGRARRRGARDANDEPPYPLGGIGGALRAIHASADAHGAALPGVLGMVVMVDSQGKAQSVSTGATPDAELAALATAVLMKETFKPARCAGQPCAMGFPYTMEFTYLK